MTIDDLKRKLLISRSIRRSNATRHKSEKNVKGTFYYPCEIFSFYSDQIDKTSGLKYRRKDYFKIEQIDENKKIGHHVTFTKLTGQDAGTDHTAIIHGAKKPTQPNIPFYDNLRNITIEIDGVVYTSKIDLQTTCQPYDKYSPVRGWRRKNVISHAELSQMAKNSNNDSLRKTLEKELVL
jgi:hypothetical protein